MNWLFGILLLVIGLWFLGGQIRAWPPGTYRSTYLHPSKPSDFLMAFFVITTAWGNWNSAHFRGYMVVVVLDLWHRRDYFIGDYCG